MTKSFTELILFLCMPGHIQFQLLTNKGEKIVFAFDLIKFLIYFKVGTDPILMFCIQ